MATVVDWLVTNGLVATSDARHRRLLLFESLAANLGLLGTFKYAAFFTGIFNDAAALAGVPLRAPVPLSSRLRALRRILPPHGRRVLAE